MVKKGLVNRARRDGRVNVVSMLERILSNCAQASVGDNSLSGPILIRFEKMCCFQKPEGRQCEVCLMMDVERKTRRVRLPCELNGFGPAKRSSVTHPTFSRCNLTTLFVGVAGNNSGSKLLAAQPPGLPSSSRLHAVVHGEANLTFATTSRPKRISGLGTV